jgi:hypothetical protein
MPQHDACGESCCVFHQARVHKAGSLLLQGLCTCLPHAKPCLCFPPSTPALLLNLLLQTLPKLSNWLPSVAKQLQPAAQLTAQHHLQRAQS